ncbi:NUDIX domain-containing protein [Breznakibacter xylanolyticus]|uniref:NUDIX domain-containing protein n=1 Tax=Breznakibacter xylanolyticus TaxID=990 RepID=A0A2W7NFT9_9BACT|nr:NUDIX domain-containing protein [Breznakibacter xylanolyticus]MBN2743399.1 NUDIX hydrolase [Marinilabiliaceae bacterium]PZX19245.1 NUDIX domain-containing protein [Breznakibacter xylanolyticus]
MAQFNQTISVDCVIFGFDGEQLNVLLVDRTLTKEGQEIFSDLTLTGNHIYEDEELDNAAARILFDLTGVKDIYLEQFGVFASPERLNHPNDRQWLLANGRNPDSRIVSVAYFSLIATKEITLEWKGRNVKWYPVNSVGTLAFDHNQILSKALAALRNKLRSAPIGFALLPEKFTLSQLQKIYEIILGTELDKRNFRKKIARMKYLIPLNEKQKGVAHKPAQLYVFDRDIYEKSKTEMFDFSI